MVANRRNGRMPEWQNKKWCRLAKTIRRANDAVMQSFILTFSHSIRKCGTDMGYLSLHDVDIDVFDLRLFV